MAEKGEPRKSRLPKTTVKQRKALLALAEGATNVAAAKAADVDESTIRCWLRNEAFLAELEPLLKKTMEEADRELRRAAIKIVRNAVDIATGEKEGSAQQVSMAKDLMNRLKLGHGDRIEVSGSLDALSNEQLQAIAEGRAG